MKGKWMFTLILTVVLGFGFSQAWAQFPNNPTWTTFLKAGDMIGGVTVGAMEGLTGDSSGNFYVADRGLSDADHTDTCHVWRINPSLQTVNLVGRITADPCRPSGLAFGPDGRLYITTAVESVGIIYRLTPNAGNPTSGSATGMVRVTGVPGANGVAFLGNDLYVTDGTENQGRVWKITGPNAKCAPASEVNCQEFFRVPPRRNGTDLGGNVLPADQPFGVGSERYTVPRHTISPVNNLDRQGITANGVAFSADGLKIFVSDTSRGAIWAADLTPSGELAPDQTGCDPTFHPNTLCWDRVHVAHPHLEGADGIALLVDGTFLASVNERNAIVAVAPNKSVADAFQNAPDPMTRLRNGRTADPSAPLEFPTSPFVSSATFCTTGADSPRRDNNPNSGPGNGEGSKVICLNQGLTEAGLPLPVP